MEEISFQFSIFNFQLIASFLMLAIALTLMPGPDILFVITQSIRQGKKAGIVFALGLCAGLIFHIAAITLGVSALIKSSPTAFLVLKVAGATYLFYLGIKVFLSRNESSFVIEEGKKEEGNLFRKGVLMNILNPKVILFFLSFFPSFVKVEAGYPALQMCFLGLLFIIQAFVIFSLVAVLASRLTNLLMKNPKSAFWVNIITAIIYFIIGISILFV
ncbi:threonine/homoserine/homoserine lactone efflux protein [Parabacteroides sp. PF5-5]|uniref:LysE family translocator n=1 Tax=unclassified Parabacteroides TaxID=2649774 RepID=UPI0024766FD8|nr:MULTISPECIES: LysE family translocator [unclassified Parabacteroides]MDH6303914.1 threonine/homoserine/homoserine lactone efflux protein [Parabacteroides sp. PH5-39]MDH6314531.1 threonine/homoserine/homoserine lactone efflux protein [Parabacteroides sp. PF5-13]MDH6318404.1 threonine/homoserine/homoserine lactone efflux protein [Parabacteroides sp. PH5-13]MDH6322303.1 threonine/homoserine/homoserine lactone efflux protein [Parabacteroides sp. PH5-8]MDH6325617.1 threonine/homoserine/homoserin